MNLKLFAHNCLYWLLKNPKKTVPIGSGITWNIDFSSIKNNSFIISAGAGHDISFEIDLAQKRKCQIILLDPSPTGIDTVERCPLPPSIIFEKKALSSISGEIRMSKPADLKEGSWRIPSKEEGDSFQSICLADLMKKYKTSKIDLLKLDIEGFEYEVLEDCVRQRLEIKQICVEIHEGLAFGKTRKARWTLILLMIFSGYRLIYQKGWDYTFLHKTA